MNMDYINKVAPSHDKTSCSDESPVNERYESDDFGGCYRCTLLKAAADAMPQIQLSKPHPWAAFLSARADVIDWMSVDHNYAEIASTLSMDQQQVSLIHMMRKAK